MIFKALLIAILILRVVPVTVTAYTPSVGECDSTPHVTARMTRVRVGIVALSRDIEKDFGLKFGDTVVIEGLGEYVFEDRMNKKWKRKVDIFMWDKQEALRFGKQRSRLYVE